MIIPTIRWANPDEGSIIKSICQASYYLMEHWVDWTKPLAGNWILAETNRPIGCVMVNFGVPFGRLEYLMILPDLPPLLHAKTLHYLYRAGLFALRKTGSQVVNFDVRDGDIGWQRAVEKRGSWCVGTGKFYVKKV